LAHKATFGQPGTLVMGTGPFVPVSLDPTTGEELQANAHWWGGPVPVQHISVKFFADEQSLALAFRGGAIDVDPAVLDAAGFQARAATKVITAPGSGSRLFSMNVQRAPWSDVHVRRAVAYAVNRQDIISGDSGPGLGTPNYYLIPRVLLASLGTPSQITA